FAAGLTRTSTHQPSSCYIAFPSAFVHSRLASRARQVSRPLAPKPGGGESLRTLRAVRVRAERKGIRRTARQTTASGTFRWPTAPVEAPPLRDRTQRLVAPP